MVKPNLNNQMKMVETVESIVQNPVLKNIDAVQSSVSSSKESVILGKTTTSDEGKLTINYCMFSKKVHFFCIFFLSCKNEKNEYFGIIVC
jgi:hypothetical protein